MDHHLNKYVLIAGSTGDYATTSNIGLTRNARTGDHRYTRGIRWSINGSTNSNAMVFAYTGYGATRDDPTTLLGLDADDGMTSSCRPAG